MDSTCINDPMMSTLLASNFLHLDPTLNSSGSSQNLQMLNSNGSSLVNANTSNNGHSFQASNLNNYGGYGISNINNQYNLSAYTTNGNLNYNATNNNGMNNNNGYSTVCQPSSGYGGFSTNIYNGHHSVAHNGSTFMPQNSNGYQSAYSNGLVTTQPSFYTHPSNQNIYPKSSSSSSSSSTSSLSSSSFNSGNLLANSNLSGNTSPPVSSNGIKSGQSNIFLPIKQSVSTSSSSSASSSLPSSAPNSSTSTNADYNHLSLINNRNNQYATLVVNNKCNSGSNNLLQNIKEESMCHLILYIFVEE